MKRSPRRMLHSFYDQALLTPELLCLNCAKTAWNRAACRCSDQRREDCLYFAGDMIMELARPYKRDRALTSQAASVEF
jgi:hypothetical protein